ncbi:MAG: PEGA domain-containing protein [Deltaproteobacteria bacterium]|nr:PEGA domain-containing protein [Deltaproteobacteria bacterium]
MIAAFAALVAVPRVADARSIAVLPLSAQSVDAARASRVAEAVAVALREGGNDVLGPAESAREVDERSPGCMASMRLACRTEAAALMGRDTIVSGRLARDPSTSDLTLSLEAVDVSSGRTIAESTHAAVGAAAGADDEELDALGRSVATSLADRLPAPLGSAQLFVQSDPPGASIRINGRGVGRTPWSGSVPEGPSLLVFEMAGRTTETRHLLLAAGELETIEISLPSAGGAVGGGQRSRSHRFDVLDGILTGLAAVGIVGGATIAVASVAPGTSCDSERVDADGDCQWITRPGNLWPAAAMITAGAAAGLTVLIRFVE